MIDSPRDRDDSITELEAFANVRAFPPFFYFIYVLNGLLQLQGPSSFEGFPGASKEFSDIWAIVRQITISFFIVHLHNTVSRRTTLLLLSKCSRKHLMIN